VTVGVGAGRGRRARTSDTMCSHDLLVRSARTIWSARMPASPPGVVPDPSRYVRSSRRSRALSWGAKMGRYGHEQGARKLGLHRVAHTIVHMALIEEAFSPLLGLPTWSVRKGHGSFITMEFGEPQLIIGAPGLQLVYVDGLADRVLVRPARVRGPWFLWVYCCEWELFHDDVQIEGGASCPRQNAPAFLYSPVKRNSACHGPSVWTTSQ